MSSTFAIRPGTLELALPWSRERGERLRLFWVSAFIAPLFLWLAFLIAVTDLPERERAEEEALPPRLARLVSRPKPPPPPVEEPVEERKPAEPVAAEPEPTPPQTVPEPAPAPEAVQQAREKASRSGILAMDKELSRIRSLGQSVKLQGVSSPSVSSPEQPAEPEGDALAQQATGEATAGGVDESTLARQAAERELEARERREQAVAQQAEPAPAAQSSARSRDAMRQTMDQQKAAIYSIYNRELRRKPSLQGTVTPELVIEENGAVSACTIADSTLNEPGLEQRICMRLRLVDFGASPGSGTTRLRYPIELVSG
jgi:outer membrane biosynthesis protein TonB